MTRPLSRIDPSVPPALVALLDAQLVPALTRELAVELAIWEHALVGVARELLGRPGKQFRSRVVELAFELGGGHPGALPAVIPQLVELLHAGSLIIDDVQDDSSQRRGGPAIHLIHGVPLAINAGTWLYFAAFHLVDHAGLAPGTVLEIYRMLSRTMFRSHQGQALDLAIDVTALRQREIGPLAEAAAALKSGELMGFAAELGALVAGASAPARATLSRFGAAAGVALQHLDDLGGLCNERRRDKGREDLAGRRLTWPWAYLADELDEVWFARLQRKVRDARSDELDELASELAALLGHAARDTVASRLESARTLLADSFADHSALAKLDAEIVDLERALG